MILKYVRCRIVGTWFNSSLSRDVTFSFMQGAQTGPGSTEGSSVKLVVLALCPEGFVAPQATQEASSCLKR